MIKYNDLFVNQLSSLDKNTLKCLRIIRIVP